MQYRTMLTFALIIAIISFPRVADAYESKTIPGAKDNTRLSIEGESAVKRSTDNSGVLQMLVSGTWKTVSTIGMNDIAISQACYELGYARGESVSKTAVTKNDNLWKQGQFVENLKCSWSDVYLNLCRYNNVWQFGTVQLERITCGEPLPDRQPLEKLDGKLKLSNSRAQITIFDGTVFTLVGPTRKDLDTLAKDSGSLGHVIFEGYRRGKMFEVVSWKAFAKPGHPFTEYIDRTGPIEGQHTALVVRLRLNGRFPKTTQDEIRSEVFNSNGGDKWNINLFERCSHGQYKIVPFTGRYAGIETFGGVMDFDIGNHAETDYDEYLYIASSLFPYDDSVDFILFVLPKGLEWGSKAAGARNRGRLSLWDDDTVLNPFIVGHELGHNLGLKHSAEIVDMRFQYEYGDHTCLMGNGYVSDDLRKDFDENTHCFNSAKNWQLGWHADRRAQWSPSDGLKTFDLVGLGDYALSNDKQVVDLQATDLSPEGYTFYISFNRKSGINSDIKEYADLVTMSFVKPEPEEPLSYLFREFGAGDWFGTEISIYVESIEIKPEGEVSVARVVLGPKDEVMALNSPINCIVDTEKSAARCTEQCGSVPGIPEDESPAYNGGSCEYECKMHDGNCTVGATCSSRAINAFGYELKQLHLKTNKSDHFCETWMQFPEHVFNETTCFFDTSPLAINFDIMVSEYYPFCTYDFSSKAEIAEEQKIKLTLTYTMDGTSKPENHEMSTQFSNKIFARNIAELLGEDADSVKVNIDRETDKIEITITTKYHADLEARVTHKWFLMRLEEKLSYDSVVAGFENLDYALSDEDEEESFFEKYKLYLIGGGAGVVVFFIGLSICLCCSDCGNSTTIIHKRGPQVVRKRVHIAKPVERKRVNFTDVVLEGGDMLA